jgi:hypothetical protein
VPLVVKRAKGTYGIQRVAYRHIDGQTYAAEIKSAQALAVPTAVVVTPQGTAGATTYGYRVTALGGHGETTGATEGTTATGNATLSGANFNRVTWTGIAGESGYAIYRTTGGATQGRIGTVAADVLTFDDTGFVASGAVPGTNTAVSFTIHVPALKPAGAGAMVKTGIPLLSARTQTGVIVAGR